MNNPFVDIPQASRDQAANLGRHYFWGVRNEAGQVFYEDANNLSIGMVPGISVLGKAKTDPYSSICIEGATHGIWIPVARDGNNFMVTRDHCSHICIMRNQHHMSTGAQYTTYVLGERWDDQVYEEQVHICPPTRYMLSEGRTLTFKGAVSTITHIGEKNAYEKFVEANA